MRDLLILGTGVHGAEMAEIVERINAVRPTWHLRGFVSPTGDRVGTESHGYSVLAIPDALDAYPEAALIADNEWPRALAIPTDRLISLIDPSAMVSRSAILGAGCVVYPHCFIGLNARLGESVFMLSGCIINHDDILDARVVLASGVTLAGAVHVEADCYLGQSCTVRQHLRIGRGSLVGMGAVVVADVPDNSVMVGNPARRLRARATT